MRGRKIASLIFLIALVISIVFLPALKNGFVYWDDGDYILHNSVIKSLSWQNIRGMFTSSFIGNYQPLTILSYALDYRMYGIEPFGYYLTNIVLHILNCILVFWLIFILSDNLPVSFITALFFGIHPLRVESVAWASGRKDMLYALFFLGALISYGFYLRKDRRAKYYYLSVAMFILSLSAKTAAVILPLCLFLIDYFFNRKWDRKAVLDKLPFFVFAALFGIVAIFAQQSEKMIWDKFPVAGHAIIFYLQKIILPVHLSCLYPSPLKAINIFSVSTLAAILATALLFTGKSLRKNVFWSSIFLVTLLPVLQFIPMQAYTAIADRYTYIPSIWVFYAAAESFVWIYGKYSRPVKILLTAILVMLIGILAAWSFERCSVWKDDISLWSDEIAKYPNSLAYRNRGVAYFNKAEIDKAISDFDEALKLDAGDKMNYKNRGAALYMIGKTDSAIGDFDKAIMIDPDYGSAYYDRALAYAKKDDMDRALSDFDKAIKIKPDNIDAHLGRLAAYFHKREYGKCREEIDLIKKLGGRDKIDTRLLEKLPP